MIRWQRLVAVVVVADADADADAVSAFPAWVVCIVSQGRRRAYLGSWSVQGTGDSCRMTASARRLCFADTAAVAVVDDQSLAFVAPRGRVVRDSCP